MKTLRILLAGLCLSLSAAAGAQPDSPKQAKLTSYNNYCDTLRGTHVAEMAVNTQGDTIVAYNCDNMLLTASNMKLVSSGVALSRLGGDYRYETRLGYDGVVSDGVLKGDLYIVGGGDPCLASQDTICPGAEEIYSDWAKLLEEAGITRVDGRILADGSFFEGEREPGGWQIRDSSHDYGTGSTGLNWGENRKPNPEKSTGWISNKDQEMDCAAGFAAYLGSGEPGVGHCDSLTLIGSTFSPELRDIARFTNWPSNNLFAEVLFRTVGFETTGSASYDSSMVAINRALLDMGVDTKQRAHIVDGSGLSRSNYASPAFFCKYLRTMMDSPVWEDFLGSLPQPGISGTVKNNLADLDMATRNAVHMKSGSMGGVRCYSGYYIPENGETIIFSALANNCVARSSELKRALDEIITIIIE